MNDLIKFLKASRAPGIAGFGVESLRDQERNTTQSLEFDRRSLSLDDRDPRLIKRRAIKGAATKEYDEQHAVLIVRESPRLGSLVQPEFRNFLESVEQQARFPTGKIVFATDNFIMGFVNEQDSERIVPVYNFGPAHVQTTAKHGRNPRMYTYGGHLLLNAIQGSAVSEFQAAWNKYLRLSVQVEDTNIVPLVTELKFRDQIRRGYLTQMSITSSSQSPGSAVFEFSMFVVHESTTSVDPPSPLRPTTELREAIARTTASVIPTVTRISRSVGF